MRLNYLYRSLFISIILYGFCYANLPIVKITISQSNWDKLENDPYSNEDVLGTFVGGDDTTYANIDLHYRGAYALKGLIRSGNKRRNWKVKITGAGRRYRGKREWNYNYEPNFNQKLAYDCMHAVGVPSVFARKVILYVNGERHGVYTEYEDPDNKNFLEDMFGDKTGDLYKAARDVPGESNCYFGETTYLGSSDRDYYNHYNKKTNIDSASIAGNYSSIRNFMYTINKTSDSQFLPTIKSCFDVDAYAAYCVIYNFMGHWDGYPNRGKNYWLYNNPSTGKWTFIPWDMDQTFREYNKNMGAYASLFHAMDKYDDYRQNTIPPGEGEERPLARRLYKCKEFNDLYVLKYIQAYNSSLREDLLSIRLDSLYNLAKGSLTSSERSELSSNVSSIKSFIKIKRREILDELVDYELTSINNPSVYSVNTTDNINIFSNNSIVNVSCIPQKTGFIKIETYSPSGKLLKLVTDKTNKSVPYQYSIDLLKSGLQSGVYYIRATTNNQSTNKKVVVFK